MGNDEFYYPRGVAVDGDGHIWVVDTQHHCIKVFDEKGNFFFRFGQGGEGKKTSINLAIYSFKETGYLFLIIAITA